MKKLYKILTGIAVASFAVVLSSKSFAVHFYDTLGTKYEGAVERLAELDIVSGVSDKVFEAERTVTRAEFAKMIVMSALKPAEYEALISDDAEVVFKDINREKKEWYYDYITVAVNAGLMKGYEDGTFRPNNDITYAEIAKMVTLALGHDYLRSDDPKGWETEYVSKMYEIGCFKNVTFTTVHEKAIRGNVANIIWNMLNTNTWKMVYRNDTSGFAYIDSNQTLFSQKIIDHESVLNAEIQGYSEGNGNLYIKISGRYYKLFDQKASYDFSTIGGRSDVLFKRVEYPGQIVRLEAIGVSTDIGAELVEGTYKQLKEEGFDLSNKTKVSKDADYAYVYHYDDESLVDRTVGIKWDTIYYVDDVKVTDTRPKTTSNDEKDTSHSSVSNVFEDDIINYRYEKEDEIFTREIDINKGEVKIADGAVLFKNNQRIDWKDLKKGDILVEISKNEYYFVCTTTTKEVILQDYNTAKDNYSITTSSGFYKTYANTKYVGYYSKDILKFNKQTSTELDRLIDRKVRLTLDVAERVVKIEALEDEIDIADVNFGVFSKFVIPVKDENSVVNNRVYIVQNGKEKVYQTSVKSLNAEKGDLIKYSFDTDKRAKVIKTISVVNSKTDLTDKIRIEKFTTSELQNIARYFEDEGLKITRIKYHYAFGKYDNPNDVEIGVISLNEYLGVDDEYTESYGIMDDNDVLQAVYFIDRLEKSTTYYGVVTKIYKDEKTGNHVKVKVVGVKEEQDYKFNDVVQFKVGDFIKYKSEKGESLEFIEKYSLDILGYYKDLKITKKNMDEKGKVVIDYEVEEDGILDINNWTLEVNDNKYNLNAYDIFLLTLVKDGSEYSISKVEVVTPAKVPLEVDDMMAIDEIDGAIVVYRGYSL